jgi:hypothetical protein
MDDEARVAQPSLAEQDCRRAFHGTSLRRQEPGGRASGYAFFGSGIAAIVAWRVSWPNHLVRHGTQMPWLIFAAPGRITPLHHAHTIVGCGLLLRRRFFI